MKYMLILVSEPEPMPEMDEAAFEEYMTPWVEYTNALIEAGAYVGGEALHDADTATTVRHADGATSVVDGPFAELKEHLGGYYIIDVDTLDDAIAWARKVPIGTGGVEVRPVMPTD